MEMELNKLGSENISASDVTIEGYVTESKYKYQQKTFVKPIKKSCISSVTQNTYIKHICPVCKLLGNETTIYSNEKTCPLCNVNLLWDNKNNNENSSKKDNKKKSYKRMNTWHITGYAGNKKFAEDNLNFTLVVDSFIKKDELLAALYEKYDDYMFIELELKQEPVTD